jgi:predicted small lipoprotein YifL
MFKKKLVLLSVFFSCLQLTACGQSGPLYHPDQPLPIYVPHD